MAVCLQLTLDTECMNAIAHTVDWITERLLCLTIVTQYQKASVTSYTV